MRPLLPLALLAAALAVAPALAAQEDGHAAPAGHHAATEHAAAEGEHAAHGGHHVPTFDDINWFYGAFGEKEGVSPDFLFRPKGMPAPFGLWILNAVVLYGFLIKVARPKVREGLKNRKTSILRGMDEAARMKREAEARLADYEAKLERIEHEVERVRSEMREGAEAERARILSEAKTRRVRMEEDAKVLVAQELSAASAALRQEIITAALSSAVTTVRSRLRPDDHQRYADEFLSGLGPARTALRGRA